jgi:DNA-binding winged helix-turn-helix (wHTH) protein
MEIRVLGSVELELGGRRLRLGGPKQRALLSLLALNANLTVSVDRLIDGLWGEEPPASAAKMVQLYVSQLRKLLAKEAGAEIVTHGRGYQLRLDREAVDAVRFERLVAEAAGAGVPRRAPTAGPRGPQAEVRAGDVASGRPERAVLALERALLLWRGAPLGDLVGEPFAWREIARLDDLRSRRSGSWSRRSSRSAAITWVRCSSAANSRFRMLSRPARRGGRAGTAPTPRA